MHTDDFKHEFTLMDTNMFYITLRIQFSLEYQQFSGSPTCKPFSFKYLVHLPLKFVFIRGSFFKKVTTRLERRPCSSTYLFESKR